MSLFRNLFRSHKQEADAPARPRLPWLRCSQSATDVLGAHLQRIPGAAVWPRGDETGAFASGRSTPTLLPPPSPSSSGHEDPINTEPSRESSFRQNPAKSDGGESHYGSHYHLRPASVLERDPISSLSSESSRPSRLNRLDPARAKEAFNAMAARLSLRLRIPAEEPTTAEVIQENVGAGNSSQRRHRSLGRLRPVKSIMVLAKASQVAPAPSPKLRRTKTFADLLRRPEPMTSLRGIEVERLAYLGGEDFVWLPSSCAPCPVQLPNCIAKSIRYLRKIGNGTYGGDLFVEPGNLKKAIRLYDYFAHHVLSAANDEHGIAVNMRVVTMPTWAKAEKLPARSVGWTMKALLAGLPGGILGSTELYNTLKEIYHLQGAAAEAFPRAIRCRLISLAIVASTREMQCALICAIFGLLTELLEDTPGYPLREVASTSRADGLAWAFGPLLTGTEKGTGTGMEATERDREDVQVKGAAQVKREIEAERVAGMLLDLWPDISYNLKGWAKIYTTHLAEYD
ncbi:hypothetical protein PENSUB_4044 [Penicillium subrubescens]|uniref:Rho-GAP domain-containing protein n=1 Tax=Penicillium subrubescens TaxID=1316194 RepID=A0A1Q5UE41_9EURO|nr:hypothetical protein PENSUB_4044 [Penicillium subrubescens]